MTSKASQVANENRQRLFRIFDDADALLKEGSFRKAALAFRESAECYRRHAGAMHSAVLEETKSYSRLSSELNITNKWIKQCSSGTMTVPISIPWVSKKSVQRCLNEIERDPLTSYLVERHMTGELMTWRGRLKYTMSAAFGLETVGTFKLTPANELLVEEIIERSRKYDYEQNPPPPLKYTKEVIFEYYKLHARIEHLYFDVCDDIDSNQIALRKRALEASENMQRLTTELGEKSDCAQLLRASIRTCLEILEIQNTVDELLSQVEKELNVTGYRNPGLWHFEPHYWNDQIGWHLNALLVFLASESDTRNPQYSEIINGLHRCASEGRQVRAKWTVKLRALSTAEQFKHIRSASRSYSELFKATQEFATKMNDPDLIEKDLAKELENFAEFRANNSILISMAWNEV